MTRRSAAAGIAIEATGRRCASFPGDPIDAPPCLDPVERDLEFARASVFLASNADSSYVTGTVLQVTGGETSRG